jgi:Cft2 family RNA processing exonuclease
MGKTKTKEDNSIYIQILDETLDKVEIEGSVCLKRCTIKKFSSFSSHASQKDLINYMKQCNCQTIVLQHGDEDAKQELKLKAQEELSKINRTTKVISSYKDMQITL